MANEEVKSSETAKEAVAPKKSVAAAKPDKAEKVGAVQVAAEPKVQLRVEKVAVGTGVKPAGEKQKRAAEAAPKPAKAPEPALNVPAAGEKALAVEPKGKGKRAASAAAPEKAADAPKTGEPKKLERAVSYNFKLLGVWDTAGIQVLDPGLKRYLCLSPVYLPHTHGRGISRMFGKSNKPIVERLINSLFVSGHKGKKHWRTSCHNSGKKLLTLRVIKDAFRLIEAKTKKNPVEVLVRAVENGSPREGTTTIEYGGVRYPKAVDIAPQRRIDLVLKWLVQGAYQAAAGGKKQIHNTLAEQIMLAADNNSQSFCVGKKFEQERQAAASR